MNHAPTTSVDALSVLGAETPPAETTTRTDADAFADTAYKGSATGWWTRYGGALDAHSGVVFIPPGADLPPCPFPRARCRARGKQ